MPQDSLRFGYLREYVLSWISSVKLKVSVKDFAPLEFVLKQSKKEFLWSYVDNN